MIKSVIALLVTASLLPAAATAQTRAAPKTEDTKLSKAEQLFREGRDALYSGQIDKAIELLAEACRQDKTKTSYRLYLARAYHYGDKDDKAEELLTAILRASPDHIEAGQLLAKIYGRQKKYKKVLAVLEPLLSYRHDYPTYHLLGEAAYNLDDHVKGRKYYEEAVKLNPDSAIDHYQLGNIYLAGNFFALAAESYEKAMSLGLDSPALRYKLGSAYFNLRNYFGKVSVATIKSGKPGTISGKWYLIEPVPGKKDVFRVAPSRSAIYQVARAIEGGLKDRPDIHFLLANIWLNARRYEQAYAMFGRIEKDIPKQDKALYYYYYSQAAFGVGRYDEYLKHLREAIKLDEKAYKSTLVEAYVNVAEQYNQSGKLKLYIRYLAMAVAESPQTAALHLKLGSAYEEDHQYANAVRQWRMVLELEPEHPRRLELLNLIGKHSSEEGR
jgi:tetratricopeptide (TPR) repeat protein